MREFVVKVKTGSTDEVRVKKYLENSGIKYSERESVFDTKLIRFEAKNKTWKRVKKDLNLAITTSYCTFKELIE